MKIDILNKSIIKSLLLALAISSFSFSDVLASSYSSTEGNSDDVINGHIDYEGGSLNALNYSTFCITNSEFGTPDAFFTMNFGSIPSKAPAGPSGFIIESSTIYADYLNFSYNKDMFMYIGNGDLADQGYNTGASIYVQNAIICTGTGNAHIFLTDESYFYAPSYSGSIFEMDYSTYAELALNAEHVRIENNSYWKSLGSSSIENLVLNNANIEFFMTSTGDTINISDSLTIDGSNSIYFSFSDEFIESLLAGSGFFDLDISNTIVSTGTLNDNGTIDYYISDSNASYSWTVTKIGDDIYRIAIPEPSAYAIVFGAVSLAFVLYRRRK